MKAKEVRSAIERMGWVYQRMKGSHAVFSHPEKPGLLIIPYNHPNGELKPGLASWVVNQAEKGHKAFR